MTSRERVIRTLEFKEIDRAPRDLWCLPGVMSQRLDEVNEVSMKFPGDIGYPDHSYGSGESCKGEPFKAGSWIDEWGSEWHAGEDGIAGEVKGYPLTDWAKLDSYKLPWECLDNADFSRVNKSCNDTDKFVRAGTKTRPFERMQFLRGTENLFMDLAYGTKEVYKLRDMLHEFSLREMEMWAKTDVDGVSFMDDWGSQLSLLISPDMWREFFKPLYKDYCDIIHGSGKYVFFHSDGNIEAIYPDLIEIGINAINSQLFCMDIKKLSQYKGKIVFWGEIDRQFVLPFGTTDDVKAAVARAANHLFLPERTGMIAQCEWGMNDPKKNIEAVFAEWNKY